MSASVWKAQIAVSFDEHSKYQPDTPVPVEIFNERLKRVAEGVVYLGDERTFEVEGPGLYLVRAELPSGESVEATVSIMPDAPRGSATLTASEKSPRETLSWAYVNRNLHRSVIRRYAMQFERGMSDPVFEIEPLTVTIRGIFRIQPGAEKWQMEPLNIPYVEDDTVSDDDPRLIKAVRFHGPGRSALTWDEVFPLYVGWSARDAVNPERGVSYVAVPTDYFFGTGPPPYEARLLFVRPDVTGSPTDRVETMVSGVSPRAEALLSYLEHGSLGAARRISEDAVSEAVNTLQDKREKPFAACIAGYFLLRAGRREKQDWLKNLADWFRRIPDGAVIYGTSLLRGERGDVELTEARRYLLAAVSRGIPVYTTGLRLLFDGLRTLIAEGSTDEELVSALARIRYIAAFADWDAQTTTFTVPRDASDLPFQRSGQA